MVVIPVRTLEELKRDLGALHGSKLQVELSEKRSVYVRAKKEPSGLLTLKLHELFLQAPTPVLEAVLRFAVKSCPKARKVIRQMAHLYFTKIASPQVCPAHLSSKGDHVDLQSLYDLVNAEYFDQRVNVPITWMAHTRIRALRHITFGIFDPTLPLIRIHRMLDQPLVPLEFTEFVVYHEMLHSVCRGHIDTAGNIRVHTAEFRRREALHRHFDFAEAWAKKSHPILRGIYGRT